MVATRLTEVEVAGERILVVEDNALLAMDAEMLLANAGYVVVGPCDSNAAALKQAEDGGFDLALLDINVTDGTTMPVADLLEERDVPFILLSGQGVSSLPERHHGRAHFLKPFAPSALLRAVAGELARGKTERGDAA